MLGVGRWRREGESSDIGSSGNQAIAHQGQDQDQDQEHQQHQHRHEGEIGTIKQGPSCIRSRWARLFWVLGIGYMP